VEDEVKDRPFWDRRQVRDRRRKPQRGRRADKRRKPTTAGGGTTTTGPGRRIPAGDEFDRVARMLELIRIMLGDLTHIGPAQLPEVLQQEFTHSWPETNAILRDTVKTLRSNREAPRLMRRLEAAGFTGPMLQMKQTSLNFYYHRWQEILGEPELLQGDVDESKRWQRVLVESNRPDFFESVVKWFKAAGKTMNSILGSLIKAFDQLEIVKEFKDHVEAAYEFAGTLKEARES
jgi:hypothetical protein